MDPILQHLGHTDIYLLDQIMKGRYVRSDIILDAGAGAGRNLYCFVQQGISVFGTDRDPMAVEALKQNYPDLPADRFQLAGVESLPFEDAFFNHVISSAVLHFAASEEQFGQMMAEMTRVLQPGGTIFIRMTTDIGLEGKTISIGNGRYHLPDGSERFLLTQTMLDALLPKLKLRLLEPFKTVLVERARSMAVLVLEKY